METGVNQILQMSPTDTAVESFVIEPKGPFSLSEAATFGFGQRHEDRFDGTMRYDLVRNSFYSAF